jgi:hypothetical protein
MSSRFARSLVFAIGLTIAAAGAASAHECLNASRSDQGNLMAGTHASRWIYFGTLEELLSTPPEPGAPALTPAQYDWALAAARAAGAPTSFAVYVGNHTIAEGTPGMAKHGADGRGIDHFGDWLPILLQIYADALEH